MLKRRLIPKIQLRPSRFRRDQHVLVCTVNFSEVVEIGDPVSQAKIYEAQASDELVFLDLDPAGRGVEPLVNVLQGRVSAEIFMPITVGGGVRSLADFRSLLMNGADKISINTAAVEDPDLINRAADAFGAQCVVLSIDYRRDEGGAYGVWARGGKVMTGLDPVAWAIEGCRRGAGEILLTSIDRDGTGTGLDVELTRQLVERVGVPVVTSGGCGLASHFVDGFRAGADAVAAGTFFCFKDQNPMQTRAHIRNSGTPIRLHT